MVSKYRYGFLQGTSYKDKTVSNLISGEFDYALLSSSWDRRCLSLTNTTSLKSKNSFVILPLLRDEYGLREKHDQIITKYAKDISEFCKIKDISSTGGIFEMWQILVEDIKRAFYNNKKPLKVLIDLTTCIRYFSLGFINQGLQSGMVKEFTIFYSEGIYPEEKTEQDKHELFTTGGWDVTPIPGLEGEWNPDKNRLYLVSVGFEGSKTLRLISRNEPDQVSLLFPEPGVKKEYVKRASELNEPIIQRFQIPKSQIIRSTAGDAIEGWKSLTEASIEEPDKNNVYYACCGTKAHSLALTLRAMVLRYPALLYIIPGSHRPVDTDELGIFWRYDLKDMSSIGG